VHGNHFLRNLPLGEKHFENIVPEDGLQLFQFQRRSDANTLKGTRHALFTIKTAVRHQNVTVGIKSEEVAEGLDSDDCAGDGIIFRNRLLEKNLQGFPGAAAEIGKKLPIVEKRTAEDFRYADTLKGTRYKMSMGYLLEDVHAQPLPEFHHTLLVARWQK
jgi:hypothetical protein